MPLALMNLWLVCCATLFGESQDANPSASTEVRLLMDILEAKPVSTVMVKEPSGGGIQVWEVDLKLAHPGGIK